MINNNVIKYYEVKNYRFQLAENAYLDLYNEFPEVSYEWFLIKDGKIYIYKGYAWDGASGPTIDTKDTIRASLIHDCLYQAMRLGLIEENYRKNADKELYNQMVSAGCWKFRAFLWYISVRLFCSYFAKKGRLFSKEIKKSL